MGRKKGSKNADRNSGTYVPKTYAPSYWHADRDDSGKPIPGQAGNVHYGRGGHKAYVNVEEDSVPDDTPIFVQGMVEDLDERDKVDQHWKGFHDVIDAGGWVRLVYGGPLDPEQFASKAEAEAKYGKRDREGFDKVAGKNRRTAVVNLVEFFGHEEYLTGWSEAELGWYRAKSIVGILFVLWYRMHRAGIDFTELYGIIHNKDQRLTWSPDDRQEHVVPKDDHFHILGRLPRNKAQTPEKIAEILGVNTECLTLPKNNRSYNNFLAYLVHIKYAWKAQYEPEEVVTLVGTPYMAVYSVNHHEWMVGRSQVRDKRASSDHELPYQLDKVRRGELTVEQMMFDDDLYLMYARHQKMFDDAEAICARRSDSRRLRDFKQKKFRKTAVFIQGPGGSGKSNLGEAMGFAAAKAFGWDFDPEECALTERNSAEVAHGHDIICGDDLDHDSFGGVKGTLRLLDRDHTGKSSERFHQGRPVVYHFMTMSDTNAPICFFGPDFYMKNENVDQVIRRFARGYSMLPPDLFGDYCVAVLNVHQCDPRTVAFPRHNDATDSREMVAQDGVAYEFSPVRTPYGGPLLYTLTGAVEDALMVLNASNGGPLTGLDYDYLHEIAQKAVERSYAPTPIHVPDAGLPAWVTVTSHPTVRRYRRDTPEGRSLAASGHEDAYWAVDEAARAADPSGQTLPAPYPHDNIGCFVSKEAADEIERWIDGYPALFERLTHKSLPDMLGVSDEHAAAEWLHRDRALRIERSALPPDDPAARMEAEFRTRFEDVRIVEVGTGTSKHMINAHTSGW